VSVEHGVSVFASEKKVTQIRYDPAATVPPVAEVVAPVATEVEDAFPTTTAGGAVATVMMRLCEAPGTCESEGKAQSVKSKRLARILFILEYLL
jgi:hypothetical protein